MKILTTQGICKEALLASRLHTNKIMGFWGLPQEVDTQQWPHNLWLSNRINKWALVNLVEENNSTDVKGAGHEIFLMLKGVTTRKKKMHVL